MKRILVIVFAVCLLLVYGCAAEPVQDTPEATTEVTTEAPTTEAPTEAPTEPKVQYTHPLTGEALDAPYTGRVTGIVLGNTKKALPQYGISKADMLYEAVVEGATTRFLAIFDDLSDVPRVGPVRSLRTFFTSVTTSYGGATVHCGGSEKGLKGYHDINNKLENWEHIDQRFNGKYFYRDADRKAQGYAYEHRLFATGEKLVQALAAKKYNTVTEGGVSYGLQFAETVSLNGETAKEITVKFKGGKLTSFEMNDKGLYEASQYKKDIIDGETKEVIAFRNVLVLRAKHKIESDKNYPRSFYTLTGEGEGYFACDGKIVAIKWSRKTVNDPFSYTLVDGTPVTLGVGKTYTAIIADSDSAGVTYE